MADDGFTFNYKGKNNVKHFISKGRDIWMTRPKSFVEEMKNLGGTIVVPTHNNNAHFLWLYDKNSNFINKYFMFINLRDKEYDWFSNENSLKSLETFEMYHPKIQIWVPCVRIRPENQSVSSNEIKNKPTNSKNPNKSSTYSSNKTSNYSSNKTSNYSQNKVKENPGPKSDPWYLKPLIFIILIIYIFANISMCNHIVEDDDSFGIETTIKSHGD